MNIYRFVRIQKVFNGVVSLHLSYTSEAVIICFQSSFCEPSVFSINKAELCENRLEMLLERCFSWDVFVQEDEGRLCGNNIKLLFMKLCPKYKLHFRTHLFVDDSLHVSLLS